jgi:molybdopterin-guanine dinucleotide biosynthesis protein A
MSLYQNAIIFAGGKSSRMGKDKALLAFGGYNSLAQYQYEKLNKIFDNVYLSAKNTKFDFPCKVIIDMYAEDAPLIALISIFESIEADAVFVLSVDTPFVDKSILDQLIAQDKKEAHIIIAQSPKGIQPLCAIYKKSILPLLKKHYQEKNYKLQMLFKNAPTVIVPFGEDEPFMNLNYFDEYEKALERIK